MPSEFIALAIKVTVPSLWPMTASIARQHKGDLRKINVFNLQG
jgi:hypothetical protein